jgi:hypothetical protein
MDKGHGKLTIVCSDWKPLRRNTLRGFAKIHIVELGMTIADVVVHETHGKLWAAPPSRAWVKDDALVRDDNGRTKYSPVFEFDRREVGTAFSAAVIRAVDERFPNALAVGEAVT